MSKITVTTIAGATSGSDANKVKIESGDDLVVSTDKLFVDASTDYIGMGTTSPATATGGGIDIHRNGGSSVRIDDTTNSVTGELQVYSAGLNLATVTNHNLILSTNNSAKMTIDGSGRVTMPSQPVFFATAEANIPLSNSYSELTAFSNGQVNVGTHYNTSNGRFTAPVAGTYQFAVASIGNSNADVYRFRPYKNGSSLNNYELRIHTEGGAYGTNGEFCFIVTLAVNDYISIFGYSDGSNNAYGNTSFRYSYFRGHLMS